MDKPVKRGTWKPLVAKSELLCPKCGRSLHHFSGIDRFLPEFNYCPVCNDVAYDDDGNKIAEIV